MRAKTSAAVAADNTMHEPQHQFDATGLEGPVAILRLRRLLNALPSGSVLKVITDHTAGVHDLPAFCALNNHHLIMAQEDGDHLILEIEKAGA